MACPGGSVVSGTAARVASVSSKSDRGDNFGVLKINRKKEKGTTCWERAAWVDEVRRGSTREEMAEIFSRYK